MVAKGIRDLEAADHVGEPYAIAVGMPGGLSSGVSGVSRSSRLMTARITLVATCAW